MLSNRIESRLAINNGTPVRETPLPYARQYIDEDDVFAVVQALKSDWLTTGPKISEFESSLASAVDSEHATAVSNGTAALHAAMYALDIGPGDEVIVPAITFAATANCVLYRGGTPVFADVGADTLLLDPESAEERITPNTKAIIAVDYGGQPCDYRSLRRLTETHGLSLVSDACHALGAQWGGKPVGSLADLSVFSFHPVKHITSGEGGAITTDNFSLNQRMQTFRNHGITTDHHQRAKQGAFFYEMVDLGYNYRITDFQCALATSQLEKLSEFVARRRTIAAQYDQAFSEMSGVEPLDVTFEAYHAYHLYVVKLDLELLAPAGRQEVFSALRAENIGVNVHYIPVYRHPYYQKLGYEYECCPVAESIYESMISLPIFYGMTDDDCSDVISAVAKVIRYYTD